MATKKDLVEAYSFSRRRLVTAFVSGAPGGREVEPARPGRMIVGGIALAILLIAGAAVAGALTKRPTVDWNSPGLVTDDHGALYIILEEGLVPGERRLRPVINVTSAQLILGSGVKTKSVPDDVLGLQKKGPSIGILNAPPTVPLAKNLLNSGWVSCTANGAGVQTEVRPSSTVRQASDLGFVVEAARSGKRYLIAEALVPGRPPRAYSYQLPDRNDGLDEAVGGSPNDQITVPDEWLALFPAGLPLTKVGLGIPDWGKRANRPGYPADTLVGDVYARGDDEYAVTRTGLVPLTDFAAAVLKNTSLGSRLPRAVEPEAGAEFTIVAETFADASWPESPVSDSPAATEQICGVLETEEGEAPAVRLATFPPGSAMLDEVAPGERKVTVEPGYGALIRSAGWNSSSGGIVHLIDDGGRSYSVAGKTEIENLGYGGVPPVVVPDSWNRLFMAGPDLSILDALCPPKSADSGAGAATGPTCS